MQTRFPGGFQKNNSESLLSKQVNKSMEHIDFWYVRSGTVSVCKDFSSELALSARLMSCFDLVSFGTIFPFMREDMAA